MRGQKMKIEIPPTGIWLPIPYLLRTVAQYLILKQKFHRHVKTSEEEAQIYVNFSLRGYNRMLYCVFYTLLENIGTAFLSYPVKRIRKFPKRLMSINLLWRMNYIFFVLWKKLRVLKDKKSNVQYFNLWNFDVRHEKKIFFFPSPFFSNIKCLYTLISFIKETITLIWCFLI